MADAKPGIARLEIAITAILFSLGGAGIKACSLTSWQIAMFRSAIAATMFLLFLPESRRGWTRWTWIVGAGYACTMLLFVIVMGALGSLFTSGLAFIGHSLHQNQIWAASRRFS